MRIIFVLLVLCTQLSYPYAQELIRGPYLQIATSSSIVIRWRTDLPATGLVTFGTDSLQSNTIIEDSFPTNEHVVQLINLLPHTKYYYKIGISKSHLLSDTYNFFYTMPVPGTSELYRIGVFGDCGNNSTNQRNVRDQLEKYLDTNHLDSWILLGDNAYWSGTEDQYQSGFFNLYKNNLLKNAPLWPSPGNHDYANSTSLQISHAMPYYNIFSFPVNGEAGGIASHNASYYSFDLGNIHFLSLDSYGMETEKRYKLYDTLSPQVQWIKKDLDSNKNKDWIIAYWHHPPYTMGSHNSDVETDLVRIRQNFIRILERYGVDLILCGHSHVYERSSLMKGFYDNAALFNQDKHTLSSSSGLYDGSDNSCPYIKDYDGTVYVVTGSSGQLGGQAPGFPMKMMQYSNSQNGGSMLLEVQQNRLNAKWICADGTIRDQFVMMKSVNQFHQYTVAEGSNLMLQASYLGSYNWSTGNTNKSALSITPSIGLHNYTVRDNYNCLADTFSVQVIAADWKKEVTIVPNPSPSGTVKIKIQNDYPIAASLILTDMSGRIIYQTHLSLTKSPQAFLPGGLPKGIYNLTVIINSKISTQKMLILE
ncbi:Por secretion system C-terminal sorting domain-containing protein [Filimonas lacunae]|uniref:Por secretion system C-terminal sorting domain-containing protein n=1 Tax=Filimonas lacunae TaxID=477680 RepID=A0A173MRD7_9BACT|nr:metallophosphoesterase [Filimonas lacunae]BAV10212.1 acid phosphatase [Filimonas lacunae]SIT18201.1 Por secretion system C-terminal sorting domain-containing protein [Filimonas lacunae]